MTYQPYTMDEVRSASSKKLFNVVSFFAGGGGSSIGYRLAGGSVLLANEFVPEAARTYRKNFPDTIVDTRDLRKITGYKKNGKHVGALELLQQIGMGRNDLDILDGSPPCTEFSRAGNGLSDRLLEKQHSDTKQKGAGYLFYDFLHVAKRGLPKVFVAENVPDLATSKTNKALFEDFLDASRFWRKKGEEKERAYFTNWQVLNAADFGVAQRRKRMFLIGVRKDVGEAIGIKSDEDVLQVFPERRSEPLTIRSALEKLDQSSEEIMFWKRAMVGSNQIHDVIRLPPNSEKETRLRHVGIADRNWNLVRTSWNSSAPTITSTGQKPKGSFGGCLHPDENRKFTLSELKRLFGLPDDYKTTGTLSQSAERIGNMVAPFVTKAIAESLYERVLRPYRDQLALNHRRLS